MSQTTSNVQNEPSSRGYFPSYFAVVVPPLAAAAAIVPVYKDLAAKTLRQQGLQVPRMTLRECVRGGLATAPTVGCIVGAQMLVQPVVEKRLAGNSGEVSFPTLVASSAAVGALSAPLLAIFNGKTMKPKWSVMESLRRFSVKQGGAVTLQETAFVLGFSAADRLAATAKRKFGNNKAVEYGAIFAAGALGSLAGHPANTALTRWQKGLTVNRHQWVWGAAQRARAVGFFACVYKFSKETLNGAVSK